MPLPEEVDHHRAAFISESADKYIVKENVCHVVFDFEDTRFMDSSGIAVVINALRCMANARADGGVSMKIIATMSEAADIIRACEKMDSCGGCVLEKVCDGTDSLPSLFNVIPKIDIVVPDEEV